VLTSVTAATPLVNTTGWTWAGWAHPWGLANIGFIIDVGSANDTGVFIDASTGLVGSFGAYTEATTGGFTETLSDTCIADHTYRWCVTYDATAGRLFIYLNGALLESIATSGLTAPTGNLYVGNDSASANALLRSASRTSCGGTPRSPPPKFSRTTSPA
jgi:hypothetical protein